jgi:hypothetical protein
MRKVTYFVTTNNSTKSVNSSANTWGELKDQLGIEADLKFVLKETRVTLESNDAILPSTDITIFGFAKKNKSGSVDAADIVRELNWLRSEVNSRIDDIIQTIVDESGLELTSDEDDSEVLSEEAALLAAEAAELSDDFN